MRALMQDASALAVSVADPAQYLFVGGGVNLQQLRLAHRKE